MEIMEHLGLLLIKQGRVRSGALHLSKLISIDLNRNDLDNALETINIIDETDGFKYIPEDILLKTIDILTDSDRIDQANEIEAKLHRENQDI